MGLSGSRFSGSSANAADGSRPPRKNTQNFLVPVLSSLGCGTSSSWRKDSFTQERLIKREDGQISLEKPASCEGQPSVSRLQSLRDVSDERSITDLSAASVQSLCGSVESTDPILFSNCNACVADDASSSQFGQRHVSFFETDRQGASKSSSQISFDTRSSVNECLSNSYDSHDDHSSNQSRFGGLVNTAFAIENLSRGEDTTGCTFKQESLVNCSDSGRPHSLSQCGSSSAMDSTSSHDTVNSEQVEIPGPLQGDGLGLAEVVDEFSVLRPESSGREGRRNNGRRLWDALTRVSSRRRNFSPFYIWPDEDVGSSTVSNDDSGLLNRNNHDPSNNFAHESGDGSRRSSTLEERRWRARPQVWALQHSRDLMGGRFGHSRHCALGRHLNGSCSCEALVMTEESSTRASISRIVMLAEALFEVLDEIHRQSITLSRSTSLSLVSLPAPEEVVNSFASRIHKKSDPSMTLLGQGAECYICLIEYEEGDYIRVLPCCHEFHMLCVDRWLKEAHRVCPLCRRNVCEESVRS